MKKALGLIIVLLAATQMLLAQSAFDTARELVQQRDFDSAAVEIQKALKEKPKDVAVLMLAGDIFSEIEKAEKAVSCYQKAYELDEENSAVARKYALALSAKGDNQKANTIIRRAIKNDKNNVYNTLALGEILINSDSTNIAELMIIKAREMKKDIPDAYLALGNLYFKKKVYELAKDNYEEALKLEPNNLLARERLATAYYQMANRETENSLANELYTRSLQEWATITKQDPKNARAFYEQGKIFFFASQFAKAAPSLAQYLRLRPDADNVVIARWYLAQSYEKLRNCDSAEPHLRYASQMIDSVKEKALFLLARCYFDSKKYKQCAEAFADLSAKNVAFDADDKERYGYALMLSGDTTNAITYIRAAIEANPTKCKTMDRLANLYYDRKMYDDAIITYRKRMLSCPDSNAARYLAFIGRSFFSANKPDSAIIMLNMALEKDSSIFFARSLMVNSYNTLGKSAEAKQTILTAIDYGKRDTSKYKKDVETMYSSLCRIYLDAKDWSSLQKTTKSMLELNKENTNAYLFAAVAAQGLQDKDGACKNYNEVLKRDPNSEVAKKNKKALGC